jgi:hypothetical protein
MKTFPCPAPRELEAPPPDPVPWLVVRRGTLCTTTIVDRTAFGAIDRATVLLKDSPAAPCLDRDQLRVVR